MLRIVCVKAGPLYSAHYIDVLHDMVTRNLPEGMVGEFTCFTDDPSDINPQVVCRLLPEQGLTGWFNKLALFKAGLFDNGDQIVYFDLDTVITGPLDAIVAYDGPFAILRDFYRKDGLQSSVMAWSANTQNHIWDRYVLAGKPDVEGGDQAWIEQTIARHDLWQDMFPDEFVSYKVHATLGIPRGAKVVVFHGEPRPHEVIGDWVPQVWKVGGGTSAELVIEANVAFETIAWQIRSAMLRGVPFLEMQPYHDKVAAICAGGPSLKADLERLKIGDLHIFAVNGSYQYLEQNEILPDYHVILDARPDNIVFVPPSTTAKQLYSSQCHPDVLDAATNLMLWHPYMDGIVDVVGADDQSAFIGGGTTAGLKAALIAYVRGYRKIHLFGFDSCYQNGANHAYPQPLNNGERILDVSFNGEDFKCAPWMVTQAEDFQNLAPELVTMGAELVVHGEGLIPAIARAMGESGELPASDLRAKAILSRLEGIRSPKVAEIGVFAADLSKRLLGLRGDLNLTMVDSWTADHASEFKATDDFHASLSQKQQDEYYELARAVTSFARDRATIIRKPSTEAAKDIPDHSLDLVFIDADHSYEGCRADIHAYWDKVKPGGYLSGHDYANDEWKFGPMVKRAVDEFVAIFGLDLELGENYTWHVVKPREAA